MSKEIQHYETLSDSEMVVEAVRQFKTGANRDKEDGKYDYEGFLSPLVLEQFAKYMHQNRYLKDGTIRASDNWQKGIPQDVYMKSAFRHFMDLWMIHRGHVAYRPEEGKEVDLHDAINGLLFNVMGYYHEALNGVE